MGKIMTAGDFSNLLIQSCNTINDSTLRTNLTNQIKTFETFKNFWDEMCYLNSGTFPNPDTFQRCLWYGNSDEYLDISGLVSAIVSNNLDILSGDFIFDINNSECKNIFNGNANQLIDYDIASEKWGVKFIDSFPHYESVSFYANRTNDNSYIIDPDTQCNLTLSFRNDGSVITRGTGTISDLTFINRLGATLKESDYQYMTNSQHYEIQLQIYDTNLVDKNNGSNIALTNREVESPYLFNISSDVQTTSSYHTITAYSESSFPLSVIRNDITDIFFNYNTIAQNIPDTEITITIYLQSAYLEQRTLGNKYSILSNATPRTDLPIRLYNSIWDEHGANSNQITQPYSFTFTSNASGSFIEFKVKKREMESFLSNGVLYGTLNVSIPMKLNVSNEYFRIIVGIPNFKNSALTGTTYSYTATDVMLSMTTGTFNGGDVDYIPMKLYYNYLQGGSASCYVMRANVNNDEIKTNKLAVPSTIYQTVVPSRIYIVDSNAIDVYTYTIEINLGKLGWCSIGRVEEEQTICLLDYFVTKNYTFKELLNMIVNTSSGYILEINIIPNSAGSIENNITSN